MIRRFTAAVFSFLAVVGPVSAAEPNDTFESATVLSSGVSSVSDELTLGQATYPDTLLGVTDLFGEVYATDDDSSPLGNGFASGLGGVPTNSGSIDFLVTGFGDDSFVGNHGESGGYEVFVDAYDFFGDPVDSFSESRTLAPGVVHEFSFSNFEWIGGSYDVYIDNTSGPPPPSDVDFFRFTGLTPGAPFAARTLDPDGSGIDTLLGWYSSGGALLETDDDDGGGVLSLIEGIVPTGGNLTFAVTGFGDSGFVGVHGVAGTYQLLLELDAGPLAGDYNDNGKVDAADYTVWRNRLNSNMPLANETASLGVVDQLDYNAWKANFGTMAAGGGSVQLSNASVPEPASWLLGLVAGLSVSAGFDRRSRIRGQQALSPRTPARAA